MDDKLIALTIEPLDAQKKAAVKKAFSKMEVALEAVTEEYNEILAQDITKEVCGDARALRIRISKVRIDGEKWKTKEKKQYLEAGNSIQGLFNYLKKDTSRKEEKLKEIEDHFLIQAQEAIEAMKKSRLLLLEPYEVDSSFVDLGNMTEEVWNAHYAGIVAAHEKAIEDEKKNSEEQKVITAQEETFLQRKEELMPYAQFHPFIDLCRESTQEDYDKLLLLMKQKKQEFDDNQAQLFEENESLKKENETLKQTPDTNKFKQDIFAGFATTPKKKELASDKDTSLGEMLGFDTPLPIKYQDIQEIDEDPDVVLTESERMQNCIDYLSNALLSFENETAKTAINSCINNLNGALMVI